MKAPTSWVPSCCRSSHPRLSWTRVIPQRQRRPEPPTDGSYALQREISAVRGLMSASGKLNEHFLGTLFATSTSTLMKPLKSSNP